MIIIFGGRQQTESLGHERRYCPSCGTRTLHRLEVTTAAFTLFFVPVVSSGGKDAMACCTMCGLATPATLTESLGFGAVRACPDCGRNTRVKSTACGYCGRRFTQEEIDQAVREAETRHLTERVAEYRTAKRARLELQSALRGRVGGLLLVVGVFFAIGSCAMYFSGAGGLSGHTLLTAGLVTFIGFGVLPLVAGVLLRRSGRAIRRRLATGDAPDPAREQPTAGKA